MLKKLICILLLCGYMVPVVSQTTTDPLRDAASSFIRKKDYANALLVLNRSLQQKPGDMDILTDMAYVQFLQGDLNTASASVKPLIARDDATIRTFQVAGNIFKGLEDTRECDRLYKKGLKVFPGSGALHSEYGELLWARQEPDAAITLWEKGIQADPSYSGNYYHAAKFYYAVANNVWSLLYGEVFVNLESYSPRTTEIKILMMETYKRFFAGYEGIREYKGKTPTAFETAFRETLQAQSAEAGVGITAGSLTMIRTRFLLHWFDNYASKFPHALLSHHQYLAREGLFEAYNMWLFGPVSDILSYQQWVKVRPEEHAGFNQYQKNKLFKMPPGQYYGYNR